MKKDNDAPAKRTDDEQAPNTTPIQVLFQPDINHRCVWFRIEGADQDGEQHNIVVPIPVSHLVDFDTAFHAAVDDLQAALALVDKPQGPAA